MGKRQIYSEKRLKIRCKGVAEVAASPAPELDLSGPVSLAGFAKKQFKAIHTELQSRGVLEMLLNAQLEAMMSFRQLFASKVATEHKPWAKRCCVSCLCG